MVGESDLPHHRHPQTTSLRIGPQQGSRRRSDSKHPGDAVHHQDLPRRQGPVRRHSRGRARRDPRHLRRERRWQVHPHEGAVRRLPARHVRRRHRLRGQDRRVQRHPRQRSQGHRHHSPGARAEPLPLDRREHLPQQRGQGPARAHRLEQDQLGGRKAAGPGRAAREPDDQDPQHRCRQAAARRDREGAVEEGQAAHSRRADRGAQRRRLRSPARPHPAPQGTGHHVDHHQSQAQRDQEDRGLGHRHSRRQDASRRSRSSM